MRRITLDLEEFMYNMKNVQKEVEMLRNDTSRVLDDVARVHRSITDLGREEIQSRTDRFAKTVEENVGTLVERGKGFRQDAEKVLNQAATQVRTHPYPIVAAVAALGLVVGVLIPLFSRRQAR